MNFKDPNHAPAIPPTNAMATKLNIAGSNLIPWDHCPANPATEFTKINNDTKYVLVLIGIIIGSFIISLLAPRKKIKSINYDLRDDTVDFVLFFIYIIGSVIGFVLSVNNKV